MSFFDGVVFVRVIYGFLVEGEEVVSGSWFKVFFYVFLVVGFSRF